ncbi:hypothetical protein DB771_16240 [Burkholderia sp. AU29985]|nr:hypothetical protein XM57_00745 [Burkholderia cepacia]AYZ95942.1 hypothetical protein EGY28_12465 [Burkholderia dolosa]ETP61343.1 hypothetical protein BDSB_26750 [Burkholderia dolosa PC543]PRE54340.1 hypothetical protein C6P87_05675 [Burkholderia sp. AU12872]PUA75892.1 hypothetical protein DB771_16240 [Burkholderia sp. AU29985]
MRPVRDAAVRLHVEPVLPRCAARLDRKTRAARRSLHAHRPPRAQFDLSDESARTHADAAARRRPRTRADEHA